MQAISDFLPKKKNALGDMSSNRYRAYKGDLLIVPHQPSDITQSQVTSERYYDDINQTSIGWKDH